MNRRWWSVSAAMLAVFAVLVVAACGGSAAEDEEKTLTFWTPFNTPDRMAMQEATARKFTEETGIKVKVVGLAVDDMNQSMVSGAASGDVPDVALHTTDQAVEWNSQGLLDADAANEVIDDLNRVTFNRRGLELVSVDGRPVTVPSDAWGQMLFYREDMLEAAGVEPPKTLDDMVAAARKLDKGDTAGIVLGTKPGEPFTMQTLEWIALASGCQLTPDGAPNEPALDSAACVDALRSYQQLAAASVEGAQDVTSTRAAYLAGRAAMISWSPHLLDEIAGLDSNFPPACPECEENTAFVAENTGFVTVLHPSGGGAGQQFGQTLNLGILRNAETDAAKRFVTYLLSDGYEETLRTGAEGRFPLRSGPEPGSDEYIEAWANLGIGPDPDNQKSITELYGEEFVGAIEQGATQLSRWGHGGGSARLESAVFAQGVLTRDLEGLFQGQDPATIARTMDRTATQVAQEIGG